MSHRNLWCGVPPELLEEIVVKFLKNQFDVLRVRAVCKPWQTAIPIPVRFTSPPPPLHLLVRSLPPLPGLPVPFADENSIEEYTIFRFDPIQQNCKSLLFQVRDGKDPVLIASLSPKEAASPINLLEYQVSEISKAFNFKTPRFYSPSPFVKLAINTAGDVLVLREGNYEQLFLYLLRVHLLRAGDDLRWSKIGDRSDHSDIIAYKEKFYATQCDGNTILIDPLLNKQSEIPSPASVGYVTIPYLAESLGDLLLVYEYFRNITVYKLDLDEEEEGRWVPLNSLGDQALFLDKFCSFSISAPDFIGCEENHIYFRDLIGLGGLGVFNLKDATLLSLPSPNHLMSLPSPKPSLWVRFHELGRWDDKLWFVSLGRLHIMC